MIIDELNKKISDIENLANDKTGSLESKVNDLTDGILMVADAVDTIPEMVDEKLAVVTKEITAVKEQVKKVKTIKGDKGNKGEQGISGLDGLDGKNGSSDTADQIATKLNTLDKVLDWKVLKDFDSLVNQNELKSAVQTLENQTRFLIQSNASKTGGTGTTTTINGLSGDVTLSEGNNITLSTTGNDIAITADFTQTGKYMISGGATWSGSGLTYDVSFLNYFFNGLKTANPDSVTLAASDPTDSRIDAIVVDEAGAITVITGTPSSSPALPPIPEDQLQVQFIIVEAGSTTPTIASENIYLDDPTTDWTFSTYTTGTPTGSINFAGTSSPKQGTECIEASTDARLGARFVRDTSFDAFQYTMLQVWVRFTGTAVATNKSLNVRFENSAGTLVANTVNLFNYGLQRGVLNTWQLVVVPITAFGALPSTVKGLKVIMAGGTVGVVRQWDIDYMILTNGSVPFANVPTIAFYKDSLGIASQSGINLIEGVGVTITAANDPTNQRVNYTINAAGGGTPAGSDTQIQYNNAGAFGADSGFFKGSETFGLGLLQTQQSAVTFTGSGLDTLSISGTFSGTYPTTYTITVDGNNQDFIVVDTSSITGGNLSVSNVITNGSGGTATILGINTVTLPSPATLLRVNVSAGTFNSGDTIDNGFGVTATTLSPVIVKDTYTYTDGTTTESNVYLVNSNGLVILLDNGTGYTIGDSWTWTYSKVQNNILDFSNGTYKFGTDFGTDYFGYEVGNNILGFGLKGSLNTWSSQGGDFGIMGYSENAGDVYLQNLLSFSDNSQSGILFSKNSAQLNVSDGVTMDTAEILITPNTYSLLSRISGIDYGISQSAGAVTLGNLVSGNNTKITIDDVNEHITISNLPAYDDDTAAGVGGLTAGMVYMTTGSGSAPLNAAGILMIKQ